MDEKQKKKRNEMGEGEDQITEFFPLNHLMSTIHGNVAYVDWCKETMKRINTAPDRKAFLKYVKRGKIQMVCIAEKLETNPKAT